MVLSNIQVSDRGPTWPPCFQILFIFFFCLFQSRLWSLNPDQFVEDEDDDTFSYSVRISAQDLLMVMEFDVSEEL